LKKTAYVKIISKEVKEKLVTTSTWRLDTRRYWVTDHWLQKNFDSGLQIVQWLRLALSKGPNRIVVTHPSQIQIQKHFLVFRIVGTDKVQKPSNSEGICFFSCIQFIA
jgi:hypothetical protein